MTDSDPVELPVGGQRRGARGGRMGRARGARGRGAAPLYRFDHLMSLYLMTIFTSQGHINKLIVLSQIPECF